MNNICIDDLIREHAKHLLTKKLEILDLFCKTFILCHQPKNIEEVVFIFKNYKLVHDMTDPFVHTYKLEYKTKSDNTNYVV